MPVVLTVEEGELLDVPDDVLVEVSLTPVAPPIKNARNKKNIARMS